MSTLSQPEKVLRESLSIPSRERLVSVRDDFPLLVRLFEIIVSFTALIVFAPVMLVIAIIIKVGTGGPVLFFQDRLGKDMKPFRFVKFRTLYADARQRFPDLYAYKYSESEIRELKFKVEHDPRVTPEGRWLRRTSLDELPNFWSVLKGDMALVGPRPEIPEMLPYYSKEMQAKYLVRPGVTGLAQISGRGRLSFLATVDYDLDYVRRRSFWFDLKIMVRTVWLILVKDGAF